MSNENTGQPKAGPKLVSTCPLCGEDFAENLPTNDWNICDPDRGCGGKFLVKIKVV